MFILFYPRSSLFQPNGMAFLSFLIEKLLILDVSAMILYSSTHPIGVHFALASKLSSLSDILKELWLRIVMWQSVTSMIASHFVPSAALPKNFDVKGEEDRIPVGFVYTSISLKLSPSHCLKYQISKEENRNSSSQCNVNLLWKGGNFNRVVYPGYNYSKEEFLVFICSFICCLSAHINASYHQDFPPDFMNGHKLEISSSFTQLGLSVSSNLTWKPHINSIAKHAS